MFLNGHFRAYRGFDFDSAIITHPDQDHYKGFLPIFSDHDIGFRTVYQSGLVERPVSGEFPKLADDPSQALRDAIRANISRLARTNVDVYGAIYVKTDGERRITAFKIESGSDLEKWFYFEYEIEGDELVLVD